MSQRVSVWERRALPSLDTLLRALSRESSSAPEPQGRALARPFFQKALSWGKKHANLAPRCAHRLLHRKGVGVFGRNTRIGAGGRLALVLLLTMANRGSATESARLRKSQFM